MNVPTEYRRTIEDIIILYRLEKNVKDLYVEGKSDKYFLEWHLNQIGIVKSDIYTIENIFIPSDELFINGYENNNRDRILFLISCLNASKCLGKYKGIIDRDILCFTRGLPLMDNVLITDYSCLEMYAYNDDVMAKINDTGFSHRIRNNLFSFINEVLMLSSSIRIFEKRMNISIRKLAFDRYIECKNKSLEFNKTKYLTAIHNSNSIVLPYGYFLRRISNISDELSDNDVRDYSNRDDFVEIFKCALKKLDIIDNNITDDIIKVMIMIAIDTKHLVTCGLFKALIKFFEER